jgi:hypothetical protein
MIHFLFLIVSLFLSVQVGFLIFTGSFNTSFKAVLQAMKRSIIFSIITIILSSKVIRSISLQLPFQTNPIM